ncbi:MAG: HlyD family efflux transporter periplasmic adaptor subunit [Desulfuromusa sp.]|jgi:HlyD family secretion protein|nr:HlyD family efflux transporter periplasmic adaptor subunit [Desulfuromusa sp.]
MTKQQKAWILRGLGILLLGIVSFTTWQKIEMKGKENNFASSNGRIEAVEIDIATKTAGRLKDIFVREGEFIASGQVVAIMDTAVLDAQLRQAKAQLKQAQYSVATASSQLILRKSEKKAALALVKLREVELNNSRKHAARTSELLTEGAVSQEQADDNNDKVQAALAALGTARAQVAAAEANITTARSQIEWQKSSVEAAQASVERIQADILDSSLISPRDGRVQYRITQPGEILGVGGRVLSIVDLSDVYMTFFLPTTMAGRVAIGTEVRLILDAVPQYVIPAHISFVSDNAQFTPKTVETAIEREKLMFRIRAQIPVDLLKKHIAQVKTGLPGMAHIRLNATEQWPPHLQVKLPQ